MKEYTLQVLIEDEVKLIAIKSLKEKGVQITPIWDKLLKEHEINLRNFLKGGA